MHYGHHVGVGANVWECCHILVVTWGTCTVLCLVSPTVGGGSLDDFLEALGSGAPTPGGGSASALAGALAAALAEMVASLSQGNRQDPASREFMSSAVAQLRDFRVQLRAAMRDDERAFQQVMLAYRMVGDTDEHRAARTEAIQLALVHAAEPPMTIMQLVAQMLPLIRDVARDGNVQVISDAGCAAYMAIAAARSARLNVLANVVLLKDEQIAGHLREESNKLEHASQDLSEEIVAVVHSRMQRGGSHA